jgi:hypothetical protein
MLSFEEIDRQLVIFERGGAVAPVALLVDPLGDGQDVVAKLLEGDGQRCRDLLGGGAPRPA